MPSAFRDVEVDSAGLTADQGTGDITIDLSSSALHEGENVIHCNLGMGDLEIIVPANVPVKGSCTAGTGYLYSW